MNTIATKDAKTHFADLVNRVAAGETVTITRRGKPLVKMVPCGPAAPRKKIELENIDEEFRKLREAVSRRGGMRGLSIRQLIDEGRRF